MKTNQLSNTAAFIAVKFYGLTRDETYRALFDEEVVQFYEKLIPSLPTPLRWYHGGLKRTSLRRFFTYWEELLLPGDLMHILIRKRVLTEWVDALRDEGYEQMLIPGSGFDHLGALCSAKGMRVLELDAPRMMQMKQDFITATGYDNQRLSLQEAFLTTNSLNRILKKQSHLRPDEKTIIVAEGFFDYFTENESETFINDINSFFTGDISMLSTIFSLQELSRLRAIVYRNSIRLAGEALKLNLSTESYLNFLGDHGYDIERCISYEEMEEKILRPRDINQPVLPGFYLIKAKNGPKR